VAAKRDDLILTERRRQAEAELAAREAALIEQASEEIAEEVAEDAAE